jgi:hypothetical protein
MRVIVLIAVLLSALLLALGAYLVAPASVAWTAAVAVYAAVLATAGFLINGRTALIDRGDLRVEITAKPDMGQADGSTAVVVRLYNAGRRPVRVEQLGFWSDKSRMAEFWSWMMWDNWSARVEIPKTFGESDSLSLWTWTDRVAYQYIRHHQPHWLWVKFAHGDPLWVSLPDDVQRLIRDAWPKALAQYEADRAKSDAQGGVDGGGQPIEPRVTGPLAGPTGGTGLPPVPLG